MGAPCFSIHKEESAMFEEILENVRQKSPLVHSITNYVTVNDCANILLACGASPIIADDPEDAEELYEALRPAVPSAQRLGRVREYRGGKRVFLR